jgi:hypothetical protein
LKLHYSYAACASTNSFSADETLTDDSGEGQREKLKEILAQATIEETTALPTQDTDLPLLSSLGELDTWNHDQLSQGMYIQAKNFVHSGDLGGYDPFACFHIADSRGMWYGVFPSFNIGMRMADPATADMYPAAVWHPYTQDTVRLAQMAGDLNNDGLFQATACADASMYCNWPTWEQCNGDTANSCSSTTCCLSDQLYVETKAGAVDEAQLGDLVRVQQYDPRVRPWYYNALIQYALTGQKYAWSDILTGLDHPGYATAEHSQRLTVTGTAIIPGDSGSNGAEAKSGKTLGGWYPGGDFSSAPETLTVTVDGTPISVTLDTNLEAVADGVDALNAGLGTAATATLTNDSRILIESASSGSSSTVSINPASSVAQTMSFANAIETSGLDASAGTLIVERVPHRAGGTTAPLRILDPLPWVDFDFTENSEDLVVEIDGVNITITLDANLNDYADAATVIDAGLGAAGTATVDGAGEYMTITSSSPAAGSYVKLAAGNAAIVRKMLCPVIKSVLGIDMYLDRISKSLTATFQEDTVYIVERSTGLLVAESAGEGVMDGVSDTGHAIRKCAVNAETQLIRSSARQLENIVPPWPTVSLKLDSTHLSDSRIYQRDAMEDGFGIDWLIVVVQTVQCPIGQSLETVLLNVECVQCPEGKISSDGLACVDCPAGMAPNAEQGGCRSCPAGATLDAERVCTTCEIGWTTGHTCRDSQGNLNVNCTGTTEATCGAATAGGDACAWVPSGVCDVCQEGFFGTTCQPCPELTLPKLLVTTTVPSMADPKVCPSRTATQSSICPQHGLWFHYSDQSSTVAILACDNDYTCQGLETTRWETCETWLSEGNRINGTVGAHCAPLHTGFRCASCEEGAVKIKGKCTECSGFSYSVFLLDCFVKLATALFLFHKSTRSTFSANDVRLVWHKVDSEHGPESPDDDCILDIEGVRKVLDLLSLNPSEAMLAKAMKLDYNCDAAGMVRADDFCYEEAKKSPTALLPIAIFFFQTWGVIAKNAGMFSSFSALNLNTEDALEECTAPWDVGERFFFNVFITPILFLLFICSARYIWVYFRSVGCLQGLWSRMRARQLVRAVHVKRSLLNAFLFLFAPVTEKCLEVLVCITPQATDANGDTADCVGQNCVSVLAFSTGTRCYESGHTFSAAVAFIVLAVYVLVIPVLLLRKSAKSQRQRDISLGVRTRDVDIWFAELDVDNSNQLEGEEIKALLRRMGEPTDDDSMNDTMAVLDPDGSGEISKEEFVVWFEGKIRQMLDSPFDLMYGTSSSHAYWWSSQVLWLKTLINLIFTFGYFRFPETWHFYVHFVVGCSLFLLVHFNPYLRSVDSKVAILTLLSLSGLSHIAAIFRAGEKWSDGFLAISILLFALPLVVAAGLTAMEAHARLLVLQKKKRKKRMWRRIRQEWEDEWKKKTLAELVAALLKRESKYCCGRCCTCCRRDSVAVIEAQSVVAIKGSKKEENVLAPAPAEPTDWEEREKVQMQQHDSQSPAGGPTLPADTDANDANGIEDISPPEKASAAEVVADQAGQAGQAEIIDQEEEEDLQTALAEFM